MLTSRLLVVLNQRALIAAYVNGKTEEAIWNLISIRCSMMDKITWPTSEFRRHQDKLTVNSISYWFICHNFSVFTSLVVLSFLRHLSHFSRWLLKLATKLKRDFLVGKYFFQKSLGEWWHEFADENKFTFSTKKQHPKNLSVKISDWYLV